MWAEIFFLLDDTPHFPRIADEVGLAVLQWDLIHANVLHNPDIIWNGITTGLLRSST